MAVPFQKYITPIHKGFLPTLILRQHDYYIPSQLCVCMMGAPLGYLISRLESVKAIVSVSCCGDEAASEFKEETSEIWRFSSEGKVVVGHSLNKLFKVSFCQGEMMILWSD